MKNIIYLVSFLLLLSCNTKMPKTSTSAQSLRFASYNVSLFRSEQGGLAIDLNSGRDTQIQNVAAVIQHVNPDVIALMEFDYDPSGALLEAFQKNYLGIGQQGEQAISFSYKLSISSNTGVLSGFDYNNDGKIALPEDGFGFGRYEGQYAFAILSKYPIDKKNIRSFQKMIWSAMPGAKRPMNEDGTSYYDDDEWAAFRVSSKNHIDIPIITSGDKTVHVILAHPTPPVFDGPEDRNGLRNYDEIRLLKDYISNATYLVDDKGRKGGLAAGESFVIMGDLNADPIDGDSYPGAINQLLEYPGINTEVTTGSHIPQSNGGKLYNRSKGDKGDPAFDSAFFGKRIDYV
ncbi:MAG: endonuclease/exonuclease/phosphatase family metal-dependent hydrolase, partial [Saprospiraceae bacterium]